MIEILSQAPSGRLRTAIKHQGGDRSSGAGNGLAKDRDKARPRPEGRGAPLRASRPLEIQLGFRTRAGSEASRLPRPARAGRAARTSIARHGSNRQGSMEMYCERSKTLRAAKLN